MVWKNNRLRALLSTLAMAGMLAGVSAPATAQQALWYVQNEVEGERAPTYAGETTPFPFVEEEVSLMAPVIEKKPEDLAKQRKVLQAAKILKEIRTILKTDEAFSADISQVVAQATATGPRGASALINNRWLGVGDSLSVPIVATATVFDYLNELEAIDPNLAEIVTDEIDGRVTQAKESRLEIIEIEQNVIHVKDERGRVDSLTFIRSGW